MPKGYTSQEKDDRLKAEFVTISKAGDKKIAMDVKDVGSVTDLGADLVEAGSTTTQIVATAHGARVGDSIRFTSGVHDGKEIGIDEVVDANNFLLSQTLDVAPTAGDSFSLLRPISLTLSSTGGISSSLTFERDGSNQTVVEDTITPANNRPLPVKLSGFTGDITVTANQLDVNLDSANDSVEIIQATHDSVNLNANLQVADTDVGNANPVPISDAGGSITIDSTALDVNLSTRASEATLSTMNGKFVDGTDIGDVTINNAGGASAVNIQDGGNSITVDNANLDATLSTRATEATLSSLNGKVTACDTGNVTIASSALPTGAATSALQTTGNTSLATIAGWDTNAGAAGATTQRVVLADESVQNIYHSTTATTYTDASSSNIPGNASLPLQLIASTVSEYFELHVFDTTGAFLEIMTGAAAAESRVALVGPGNDQVIKVNIASGTRISVRRVDDAAALTVGSLAINYMS